MIELGRRVERRIVSFDHKPTDQELGTDLGYSLMGGSTQILSDDDKLFKVMPQIVPLKYVAIWMYFVLSVMAVIMYCTGGFDPAGLGIILGGAIMIVPMMLGMFAWLNDMTGKDPFLVYDKVTDQIQLPRLSVKYSKKQLHEVIFLDRFVDRFEHWQVGLLIEEGNGSWTYLHLFNTAAATNSGNGWLGFKDDDQKIADALGIGYRRLSFTPEESTGLRSLEPRFSC